MKLHYYAETDSLYVELRVGSGVEVRMIADGFNADIDGQGQVVGFDIDQASTQFDLSKLAIKGLRDTRKRRPERARGL